MCVFDAGTGPELYLGGEFGTVGGSSATLIARWNGALWSSVGGGLSNGAVYALSSANLGSGTRLYAAGTFIFADSNYVRRIAMWDGAAWSELGLGVDNTLHNPYVLALCPFDDGTGNALYAGGSFTWAGGVTTPYIAKWDGATWGALGTGMNGWVHSLQVFDDGSGPAIYAGGSFTSADGVPVENVARWTGTNWSAVGAGLNDRVAALAVCDDGSGPALYAGGAFSLSGSLSVNHIAKWNGVAWLPLGAGFDPGTTQVSAIAEYDDGTGSALYAAGVMTNSNGVPVNNIAKWNGTNWLPLGPGTNPGIETIAGYTTGVDHGLFAGGAFSSAGSVPAAHLAKWANSPGCGQPGVEFCFPGISGVTSCPCGNPPPVGGTGCDNSSSTGGARLTATGTARIGYDSVVMTTIGEKPSATSVILQGTSANSTGSVFGQGVRCVAGSLKRLYLKVAVAGSISAPGTGEAPISARSATLGDSLAAGSHRYYGVYYRDPTVLGGCPASSTFNITQQLDILWAP